MKQLLAGAVLLGAATWFGRTTQERARGELEQAQMVPDFIDRMSEHKYSKSVCARTAEFMKAARDEHIHAYVNAEEMGHLHDGTMSPCALDIRQGVKRVEDAKGKMTTLTRHRRFTPYNRSGTASTYNWCDPGRVSKEGLMQILGAKYDRYNSIENLVKMVPESVDKALRALINAKRELSDCPGIWDESQGFTWAFAPKEAAQAIYDDQSKKKSGGWRFL